MTAIPKLVSDLIIWYQWKAGIRLVNKEYHESYKYVTQNPQAIWLSEYLQYTKKSEEDGVGMLNWRDLINHPKWEFYYYDIWNYITNDRVGKDIPDGYCTCCYQIKSLLHKYDMLAEYLQKRKNTNISTNNF